MEHNEFPGNSNAEKKVSATPEKKIEKLDIGAVTTRKKPLGRKIREFLIGDSSKSVVQYVWFDILIPGAKDMLFDSFTQGMEKRIYGDVRSGRRRGGGSSPLQQIFGNAAYNPYNRYSASSSSLRQDPRQQNPMPNRRGRMRMNDLDDIIFGERHEATECLDAMIAICDQYESVSVADLWELLGRTGEPTDEKWGWTDLIGTDIVRTGQGYLLDLTPPTALD